MRRSTAVLLLVMATALVGWPRRSAARPVDRRAPLWLAQGWQQYSPGERYEALRNYEHHREQPQEKRREVEKEYQRWQQMPEQERDRIRRNYQRYQKMPPRERSEFERKYRSWKHGK